MARSWKVFDNWEGGGFFAGGSYAAKTRFNALNMQRYQNGSIGPRPGWRKLTQSDYGSAPDSVPSVPSANKSNLQHGAYWAAFGNYIVLIGAGSGGDSKRIDVSAADGTAVYRDAADVGYSSSAAANLLSIYSAYQINGVQAQAENNRFVFVGGSNIYNADTNALSSVTGRTIGTVIYPSNSVFYKGRMYGWQALANTNLQYIVYTDAADLTNFSSGDSGAFAVSGVVVGGNAAYIPHGLWALGSGLLIFATSGPSSAQPGGYTGYGTTVSEHGRWFMLTGSSDKSGTLSPIERDIGPLFYSLSILHDSKVLFPIHRRGWAVHDGNRVDKVSLQDLRPGRGQYVKDTVWLNPLRTLKKPSLILPFYTYEADPTADPAATSDQIGEFWNYGLGAFEFINSSWTESLYLHGQTDIVCHGQLLDDKLFAIHLDSSDGGTNFFPQVYTRDTTLDRPATTSSQNTYNPYSDGDETAPTNKGGAAGSMAIRLETGEFVLPEYSAMTAEAVVIDYDYWNSDLFHGTDCGFDVYLITRSVSNYERTEHKVNNGRVTPPGESTGVIPKRGRAVLNLQHLVRDCGSVQVRLDNIVDCAIYSIALAYDRPSTASGLVR